MWPSRLYRRLVISHTGVEGSHGRSLASRDGACLGIGESLCGQIQAHDERIDAQGQGDQYDTQR